MDRTIGCRRERAGRVGTVVPGRMAPGRQWRESVETDGTALCCVSADGLGDRKQGAGGVAVLRSRQRGVRIRQGRLAAGGAEGRRGRLGSLVVVEGAASYRGRRVEGRRDLRVEVARLEARLVARARRAGGGRSGGGAAGGAQAKDCARSRGDTGPGRVSQGRPSPAAVGGCRTKRRGVSDRDREGDDRVVRGAAERGRGSAEGGGADRGCACEGEGKTQSPQGSQGHQERGAARGGGRRIGPSRAAGEKATRGSA